MKYARVAPQRAVGKPRSFALGVRDVRHAELSLTDRLKSVFVIGTGLTGQSRIALCFRQDLRHPVLQCSTALSSRFLDVIHVSSAHSPADAGIRYRIVDLVRIGFRSYNSGISQTPGYCIKLCVSVRRPTIDGVYGKSCSHAYS